MQFGYNPWSDCMKASWRCACVLNFRVLILGLEVLALLVARHYDYISPESDFTLTSANYLQLCNTRTNQAAILGLKTISSALPPKKFKRKFLHSAMKYTTNGVLTFNALILELQLFQAWDVNPNSGPTIFDNNNKEDKTNKLSLTLSPRHYSFNSRRSYL